jgi:hypothetical protein
VKIVKPTWCELIALEPSLAPMAPAVQPTARDLRAYTLNAAPTPSPPWRTPAYNKAVYGGHAWGGVRWCTSVYGRCTGGVRSSLPSVVVKRPTAIWWLNQRHILIVKVDRQEPLLVLRMSSAADIAKRAA